MTENDTINVEYRLSKRIIPKDVLLSVILLDDSLLSTISPVSINNKSIEYNRYINSRFI